MSKLLRYAQKVFGSTAGASHIGEFGSFAAGTPAFATTPAQVQALGNYLTGWFGAIVGANAPAIEDMNALCFLFAYQLAYLMQEGVAEWETNTIYFKGSVVNDGNGLLYISLTDNNQGNALTSTSNWSSGAGGNRYNKVVPSPAYPTIGSITFQAGDSILITRDATVAAQVLVNVDDVRIDMVQGAAILSTVTNNTLFKVTGNRFQSSGLTVWANGALGPTYNLVEIAGSDAIISAFWGRINNGAIAMTNPIAFTGNRNDITSGIITEAAGTFSGDPVMDTGTNNDSRIRST